MVNRIQANTSVSSLLKQTGKPAGFGFDAILRSSMNSGNSSASQIDQIMAELLGQMLSRLLVEETDNCSLPSPFLPPALSSPLPATTGTEASNKGHMGQDFEPIVSEAAEKYQVDPNLIRSIITVESGGDPKAVSRAGACGLMQLMPATSAELGVTDPFDPAQNIMAGTCYLKRLLNRYRGNVNLALAAYNWGMGNVEKRLEAMPSETRRYISQVNRYHEKYTAMA